MGTTQTHSPEPESSTKSSELGLLEALASKVRKADEFEFIEVPAFTAVRNWNLFGWYVKKAFPEGTVEDAFTEGNLIKAVEIGELTIWTMFHKGKLVGVVSTMVGGDQIIGPRSLVVYTMAAVKQLPAGIMDAGLERLKVEAKNVGAREVVMTTQREALGNVLEAKGFKKTYMYKLEVK